MRLLKPILCTVLALLVLLSGMGVFVEHAICITSGRHKLAINTQIARCNKQCTRESTSESIQRQCCEYDSNYFKEDLQNHRANSNELVSMSVVSVGFKSNLLEAPIAPQTIVAVNGIKVPLPKVRWQAMYGVFVI